MIARLQAVGRDHIIPDSLTKYGEIAMNMPTWLSIIMEGRTTMYDL
jgi:hypothetical protein